MGASSLDPAASVSPLRPAAPVHAPAADSLDRFGFPSWGYEIDTLVVPQDVSLNAVFVAEGLSFDAAERLVGALASGLADSDAAEARRAAPAPLTEGDTLLVYRDSTQLSHFVFEPSFRSYVVLRPGILPVVHEVVRPEVRADRVVRTVVQPGGLARTFAEADAPKSLADSLDGIFGGRYGLGALRRGDSLAVLYPEARIGSTVTDTGAVLAVRLGSGQRARYAFRYTTRDGRTEYYDADGQNWRSYFLGSPVRGAIVSSSFSPARFHPVLEYWKPHLGTDYAAPMGAPILALADGVIMEATYGGGNGLYVKMQHDATYTTAYLHMSRLGAGIAPGRKVRQGDVLGYVGQTGLATGPHTCLRFYRHGVQVDFERQGEMPAPGVPASERLAFERERDRLFDALSAPAAPAPLLAFASLAIP